MAAERPPQPDPRIPTANALINNDIGRTSAGQLRAIQDQGSTAQFQYTGFANSASHVNHPYVADQPSGPTYPMPHHPSQLNYQLAHPVPQAQYYGPALAYPSQAPYAAATPISHAPPAVAPGNALSAFDQVFGSGQQSNVEIRTVRGTFVMLHTNCETCTRYAQHLPGLNIPVDGYSNSDWQALSDHLRRAFPGIDRYITDNVIQSYERKIRKITDDHDRAINDLRRRDDDEFRSLQKEADYLRQQLGRTTRDLNKAEDYIESSRRRRGPSPPRAKRRRSRSPTPPHGPSLINRIMPSPRPSRLEDRLSVQPSDRHYSPSPSRDIDDTTTMTQTSTDVADAGTDNGFPPRMDRVPRHDHLPDDLQRLTEQWAKTISAIPRAVRDADDGQYLNSEDVASAYWLKRVCQGDGKKRPLRANILKALSNPEFITRSDAAIRALHLQPAEPLTNAQITRPDSAVRQGLDGVASPKLLQTLGAQSLQWDLIYATLRRNGVSEQTLPKLRDFALREASGNCYNRFSKEYYSRVETGKQKKTTDDPKPPPLPDTAPHHIAGCYFDHKIKTWYIPKGYSDTRPVACTIAPDGWFQSRTGGWQAITAIPWNTQTGTADINTFFPPPPTLLLSAADPSAGPSHRTTIARPAPTPRDLEIEEHLQTAIDDEYRTALENSAHDAPNLDSD
ncbi:hypothetical protein SISSUDRAFT_1057462 [Sistotremastrum suecicum HHB10207 ss-3]|uniref:Uncharacterized protein n=1 Tax=Sistotremastrum suecicum HHB10207 ss-3 TaxID=1314776 RepID=A0A166IPQ8_9AGAM|nr:hypothetical protein SISSUDRAFT_1057462 [Sistotremastrum suecicum HHB10207 ss-3]